MTRITSRPALIADRALNPAILRTGLDRCEVRLSALGRAFRRISDGSPVVDRCEIAGIALGRATHPDLGSITSC
jgi:hypothetical protein